MIPLFSESEKGTAGFVDGVHGPRKDPWREDGLHVQDRSEIAASPPFKIPSSVSAERELGKEIRPIFPLEGEVLA